MDSMVSLVIVSCTEWLISRNFYIKIYIKKMLDNSGIGTDNV